MYFHSFYFRCPVGLAWPGGDGLSPDHTPRAHDSSEVGVLRGATQHPSPGGVWAKSRPDWAVAWGAQDRQAACYLP